MTPSSEPHLSVLASPAASVENDNPYLDLLYGLMPGVRVTAFTRRRLLDRYDVVHVHWPEFLIRWERLGTASLDIVKVLVLLAVARRRGAVLVWTGHDLSAHESVRPRLLRAFQRGFVRQVDGVINLADGSAEELRSRHPGLAGTPMATVRHGHYRDSYGQPPTSSEARATLGIGPDELVLLMLGQLREYKNAEALMKVVGRDDHLTLIVAGRPHDQALRTRLAATAKLCDRVHAVLETVPHQDVPGYHGAADVVVLPYKQGTALHSGAALLALSLNRPVVMAASSPAKELREVVGPEWVYLHDGTVPGAIAEAKLAARQERSPMAPLQGLDWPGLRQQTVDFYRVVADRRKARKSARLL